MATDVTENSPEMISQEMEKLLKLAEDLQEKCERRERWVLMYFVLTASVVFAGVATTLYFSPRLEEPSFADKIWGILAFAYSATSAVLSFFLGYRSARVLRRDKRALLSIVDMLRELEKPIADNHQMSMLERAEFRIRLSRFDVGPGLMPWS